MNSKALKILLVEDDQPTVEEFRNYFDGLEDFEIIGIADGETKAIEILKNDPPSVAIVDISLREGNGTQFIKKVFSGEYSHFIPYVVVITALETEALHRMLRASGVNRIFGKYEPQYSVERVVKWLRETYKDLPKTQ